MRISRVAYYLEVADDTLTELELLANSSSAGRITHPNS